MTNETVTIATPDHGTLEFELAGLGSRFCAHVVDSLLIGLLMVALAFLLYLTGLAHATALDRLFEEGGGWGASWSTALLIVGLFLILWGYYVFFECVMHGRTPGKKELGLRVIREDALPIGFREAALRNLVRAADSLPPPAYWLGGIVMFLDPRGRRLGDMVAGTIVVREKLVMETATGAGAAWAARVEKGHSRQAVALPGGTLAPAQIDLVEQFLARRFDLLPERRTTLAWQISAPLLTLSGEDATAWERLADRTEQCERFLLGLVELAKATRGAKPVSVAPIRSGGWF